MDKFICGAEIPLRITTFKQNGGAGMNQAKENEKSDILKTEVNGKPVTLLFTPEQNNEAADFIKRTLINAYLIKAI